MMAFWYAIFKLSVFQGNIATKFIVADLIWLAEVYMPIFVIIFCI